MVIMICITYDLGMHSLELISQMMKQGAPEAFRNKVNEFSLQSNVLPVYSQLQMRFNE